MFINLFTKRGILGFIVYFTALLAVLIPTSLFFERQWAEERRERRERQEDIRREERHREAIEVRWEVRRRAINRKPADKALVRKERTAQDAYEWGLQLKALDKRLIAAAKKLEALVRATTASADAKPEAMLDAYALLSDEQLKYARAEALKTMPADKVAHFFNDLTNYKANATPKTPEQIAADSRDILASREARRIADWEVKVEREQIQQELDAHYRNKP